MPEVCCVGRLKGTVVQDMRMELRKATSSSLSALISPKSSCVDAASAEGRIPSRGSDYQRRNRSGGSQAAPEPEPTQQFDGYPSLKRGL